MINQEKIIRFNFKIFKIKKLIHLHFAKLKMTGEYIYLFLANM